MKKLSFNLYYFITRMFLLFLCLYHLVLARIYYVSTFGSNTNPGTFAQPWSTPGYGSRQLSPGDTLIILGGRYILQDYDADIITPPSGSNSAWITIRGEEGDPSYISMKT